MIVYKVILTILVTSILIFISERKPRVGGLISGLPIGTGIVVIFYNLELGKDFVLQGIPFGILGLVSSLIFCLGFYLGGRWLKTHRLFNVILAFSLGSLFFFLSGVLLSSIKMELFYATILLLIFVSIFFYFFSKRIYIQQKRKRLKTTSLSIIFRVVFVTIFIITITGIAGIVGVEWSGILASFPTGLSPILIVMCWNYGEEKYLPILKYFTLSITTLLIFYLIIFLFSSKISTGYSIGIAYILCLIYVYILHLVTLRFNM